MWEASVCRRFLLAGGAGSGYKAGGDWLPQPRLTRQLSPPAMLPYGSMAGGESWRPPRPCEDYWWEWKHCRGLRHAFHHYYAHGELPACGRWKEDYEACRSWERDRDTAAQEALCESERARVMERQKHAPVWRLRKSPPPDWYLPLDQDKPN